MSSPQITDFRAGEMVQKSALELQNENFRKSNLDSQTGGMLFHPMGIGQIITNHDKTSLKVQNSASGHDNHGSKNLLESPKMPKSRNSFKITPMFFGWKGDSEAM